MLTLLQVCSRLHDCSCWVVAAAKQAVAALATGFVRPATVYTRKLCHVLRANMSSGCQNSTHEDAQSMLCRRVCDDDFTAGHVEA